MLYNKEIIVPFDHSGDFVFSNEIICTNIFNKGWLALGVGQEWVTIEDGQLS